jgi:hypothetical protein
VAAVPGDVHERVREAIARRRFARALDLCDLGLNQASAAPEVEALRALQEEARAGAQRPYPPPRPPPAAYRLGVEAQDQGRFAEAVALFRAALAEDPACGEAHAHLGMCLIGVGELAEGWREYEWRTRLSWGAPRRMLSPRWNGEPMVGKTLLLWDEQGQGDAIQFARFAAPAAERSGARVVFHGRPRLARLFRSMPALAASIPRTGDFPSPDANASLMSLPAILGSEGAIPGGAHPYLFPERDLVRAWRARLAELRRPLVGLVWQGNPNFYADRWRSIPLAAFVPMLRALAPRASFISLQKGSGEGQIVRLPRDIVLHQPDLDAGSDGFVDTAAVIANLDLTITTDTSIAHLAGALGARVWIVLGDVAEWRWGESGTTTPFYPSARLFRGRARQGWEEVLGRVSDALAAFADEMAKQTPKG